MLLHIIFEFLRSFYAILTIEKAFLCLRVLLQLQRHPESYFQLQLQRQGFIKYPFTGVYSTLVAIFV